jgi:hypothetical protein
MYLESLYNYFNNFRKPVEGVTNEIVLTSFCICFHLASHLIHTKCKAFEPLPNPLMGLREGLGVKREGLERRKEEIEMEG